MERSRNLNDVLAGVVTAAVCVLLLIAARRIQRLPGDTEIIGPSAFPTALSLVLIAAGLALSVTGLRSKTDDGITAAIMQIDDSEDVTELIDPQEPPVPLPRLLLMIGYFAAYCVSLIPAGFLVATTTYLAVTTCTVHPAKWRRNLAFAVGFSVVVYFSFTKLLAVELPAGVLG